MPSSARQTARNIVGNLPFLAFFAALFFADMALFGVSDALIGIVFLFFSRTIVHEPGLSPTNYARRAAWFFLMALCATLAGLHPVAMVVVTTVYMFVMTVFNSDDYLPRNFFWLGLGYLLLLIYPVGVDGIGMRLAATVFSLAWTTLFIFLMRFFLARTGELDVFVRDRGFVRRALDEVAAQLESLAAGQLDRIDPKRVFGIAQEYATLEYGTVYRQDGLLSGRQSYTFALLLCTEQVVYNAHAAAQHYDKFDEDEKTYYRDLAQVMRGFGQGRIHTVREFADALQGFLDSHALSIVEHEESWRAILEAMLRTVRDTRTSRDDTTPFLKSAAYRLYYLRDNINLQNTQTRFALQLAVIVGVAMAVDVALTQQIGALYAIWIPITAFTILNTYNDETLRSTLNNFIGTMTGIGVFAIAVHFIPDPYRMPLVVVLSYGVILMDFGPATNVASGTQMALTALYPLPAVGAEHGVHPPAAGDPGRHLHHDGDLPVHAHAPRQDHPHQDRRARAHRRAPGQIRAQGADPRIREPVAQRAAFVLPAHGRRADLAPDARGGNGRKTAPQARRRTAGRRRHALPGHELPLHHGGRACHHAAGPAARPGRALAHGQHLPRFHRAHPPSGPDGRQAGRRDAPAGGHALSGGRTGRRGAYPLVA